ncbi:MAG: hypothetical protein WKG01_41705 [Kofleriaceae bacterium]
MPKLCFKAEDKPGSPTDAGNRKIRCPRCLWQPGRHDLWACACGHTWHTFDTRGICPACDAAWRDTQCLRCQAWSRHDDWYP